MGTEVFRQTTMNMTEFFTLYRMGGGGGDKQNKLQGNFTQVTNYLLHWMCFNVHLFQTLLTVLGILVSMEPVNITVSTLSFVSAAQGMMEFSVIQVYMTVKQVQ